MFEASTALTVLYYLVAMTVAFFTSFLIHEYVYRLYAWSGTIKYSLISAPLRGIGRFLMVINRWMWPFLIAYFHYGNQMFELISISGVTTGFLYMFWYYMLEDTQDTVEEFEREVLHP